MKSAERASFAAHAGRDADAGSTPESLASALHEVSNALTVVVGWLADARELARDSTLDPAAKRARAEALESAIEVAHRHARRGYAVARNAIGSRVEEEEGLRTCVSVARDAAVAALPRAAAKEVRIQCVESNAEVMLEQPNVVLQILINLLLNAVAFSPKGGRVELRVDVSDGLISFLVGDEGPGVPAELRDGLFHSGESQRRGGAGIGLAHSHALALEHGGRLRLSGDPRGKGAWFELLWPVADAPSQVVLSGLPSLSPVSSGHAGGLERGVEAALAPASASEDRGSAPPTYPSWSQPVPSTDRVTLRGMRVLLLEDDEAVLDMLNLGLVSRGAEVLVARSLKELLSLLAREEAFSAALLDLSPLGPEPAAVLGQLVSGNVPIVLISGSVAPSLGEVPLAGWVHKPFALDEIYDALLSVGRGE